MRNETDQYLKRINMDVKPEVNIQALAQILKAHTHHIPFENLSSYLGLPVSTNFNAVFLKLVTQERGGYCFEHSVLSRRILTDLGFKTTNLIARVYWGPEPEQLPYTSHMATVVIFNDRKYLFDPGFGGMIPAIPLEISIEAGVQSDGEKLFRFIAIDSLSLPGAVLNNVELMLQVNFNGDWQNMYGIVRFDIPEADYRVLNWYTANSPESKFTYTLIAARKGYSSTVVLRDLQTRQYSNTGVKETELKSLPELSALLRDQLQINIDQIDSQALYRKLKDLD